MQATTLRASPADLLALQAVARWIPAFPAIFFAFLASQPALYESCTGQLAPAEVAALRAAKQPSPLLALTTMSRLVQRWEAGWAAGCCQRLQHALRARALCSWQRCK